MMHLRMYYIDTEALVLMFNGGSSYSFIIHPISTRIGSYHFYRERGIGLREWAKFFSGSQNGGQPFFLEGP